MAEQLKEHIKDPGSAITHFIGMLMAIFAAIPLLLKAAREPSKIYIIAIAVYAASLILLYAASTTYHTFDKSKKVNTILKKIDHMMISVLIAGSYTPICLLVLGGRTGIILLAIVWSFAIAGILIKAFWVYCPKWVSSVLYIGMGWAIISFAKQTIQVLTVPGFVLLLLGGIAYTIGSVLYGLGKTKKWMHSVFHIFVVLGAVLQYFAVLLYAI